MYGHQKLRDDDGGRGKKQHTSSNIRQHTTRRVGKQRDTHDGMDVVRDGTSIEPRTESGDRGECWGRGVVPNVCTRRMNEESNKTYRN